MADVYQKRSRSDCQTNSIFQYESNRSRAYSEEHSADFLCNYYFITYGITSIL